jgi:hypothetical protein
MRRHAATLPTLRTTMVLLLAVCGLLVTGCFDPTFKEGLACGPAGECPSGRTCRDGVCQAGAGAAAHDAPVGVGADAALQEVDAPLDPSDAGAIDAPLAAADAPPTGCVNDPDCASLTDECGVGACNRVTGDCVKLPANGGAECGEVQTCGELGACGGFDHDCDSTGTQSRTCTAFTCQSGACTGAEFTDIQTCTVATENRSCGDNTVSGCGACGGFDPVDLCDETGTMSCTCTSPVCRSDVCTNVMTSCSRPCTRNTDGEVCGVTDVGCPRLTVRDLCCSDGRCTVGCGDCS